MTLPLDLVGETWFPEVCKAKGRIVDCYLRKRHLVTPPKKTAK